MEHRFGQRIRRRELPELRLEVDRSPTPVDRRGGRRSPGAGVIVRATELPLGVGSPQWRTLTRRANNSSSFPFDLIEFVYLAELQTQPKFRGHAQVPPDLDTSQAA